MFKLMYVEININIYSGVLFMQYHISYFYINLESYFYKWNDLGIHFIEHMK